MIERSDPTPGADFRRWLHRLTDDAATRAAVRRRPAKRADDDAAAERAPGRDVRRNR